MSSAMRPVFVVGGLTLAVALFVSISEWRTAHAVEIVPWRGDWESAKTEAVKLHRPLFVYFTAAWCPPCQEMKKTTWADKTVKTALEKFVPVKVDVEAHPEIAEKFGVNAMPTYVILSEQGEVLRHRSGMLMPEEMLRWLEN